MRSIIKRNQVNLGEPSARVQAVDVNPPCTPKVGARLVDLDGRTKAIEFTCPCGETSLIEIQCEETS